MKQWENIITKIERTGFFRKWTDEQLNQLTAQRKDEIIEFATNKPLALARDNHACQNELHDQFEMHDMEMQIHHIVPQYDFKMNPNLVKYLGFTVHALCNLITLCATCHQSYEHGKNKIMIKGMVYFKEKTQAENYKQQVIDGKLIRKRLKQFGTDEWQKIISKPKWEMVAALMWFVFQPWNDIVEFDN